MGLAGAIKIMTQVQKLKFQTYSHTCTHACTHTHLSMCFTGRKVQRSCIHFDTHTHTHTSTL